MSGRANWFRGLTSSARRWLFGGLGVAVIAASSVAVLVAQADDRSAPGSAASTTSSGTTADTVAEVDDDALPIPYLSAAGAITEEGAVTERRGAAATDEDPGWESAELDPHEDAGDEFFEPDDPVAVPALAVIGDLTSNAVGCESNCIIRALLHPKLLVADVGLEVETNVAATITVWITKNPVEITDGVPTFPGVLPIASSPGPQEQWSTDLGPLEFDTTYYVIVRATDLYDNSRYAVTDFTTIGPPSPGQLVGNGGGCYYQCIVSGSVMPTDSYDTVLLVVTTSVPADFDIAVSTQEPGFVGDSPILPHDEPFIVEQDSGTAIGGSITGLSADTTYHVVVKATDANGFTAHAIGEFHTSTPPRVPAGPTEVFIRLERVTITEDGDPVGAGEILISWGLANGDYFAYRDFDRTVSGDTVVLPPDTGTWVSVPADGDLPNFAVNTIELDYTPYICTTGYASLDLFPDEDIGCGTRSNFAATGVLPLTWLNEMVACSSLFNVPFGQDRRCLVVESQNLGNAWPAFTAIVSFDT